MPAPPGRAVAWVGLLALLLSVAVLPDGASAQETFVVNSVGDAEDLQQGEVQFDDGVCDTGATLPDGTPECTLRAAIQTHNANRITQNNIFFELDLALIGEPTPTIRVGSTGLGALPPVLGSVHISGSLPSDPNFEMVEVDGSLAGAGAIGLRLLGGDCEIRRLVINRFDSHGMFVGGTPPPGGGGHTFERNYIGTDLTGQIDLGNGGDGIFIDDTPGTVIGGDFFSRNVISGNEGYAVRIVGQDPEVSGNPGSGAPNNEVKGNFLGLDAEGLDALPNTQGGVLIQDARDIEIGGETLPDECLQECNQIVGEKTGVTLQGSLSTGLLVKGNFIGKGGTGATFTVGVRARAGENLVIEGNAFTQIDSVGVDLRVKAGGGYNVRANEFTGTMTVGTKITFEEGDQTRVIDVEYSNNVHVDGDVGVEFIEPKVQGTINWTVLGNRVKAGQTGAVLEFRARGLKKFGDVPFGHNEWEGEAGFAVRLATDLEEDVRATIDVAADVYANSGLGGLGGRIEARGEVAVTLLDLVSRNNAGDGVSIEFFGAVGTKVDVTASFRDVSLNAEAGVRMISGASVVPFVVASIERSLITENGTDGLVLFGIDLLRQTLDTSTITGNGGAGLVLGGATRGRIADNLLSGNDVGVLVQDATAVTLEANTITDNGTGVVFVGSDTETTLAGNAIFGNTGLGIDLGGDGVTPNDPRDADAGPNTLQNFPVLTAAAVRNGTAAVRGTLGSTPDSPFRVEVFASAACDASGFGEGETFLGAVDVTTDPAGDAAFSLDVSGVPPGAVLTATATNAGGSTSEFGACLVADGAPPTTADLSLTKTVDDPEPSVGGPVAFTVVLRNDGPDAADGVEVTDLLPAGLTLTAADPSAGAYDAGTGVWAVGPLAPGGVETLVLSAVVQAEGPRTNTAEVTASITPDPDSTPGNGAPEEDDQASASIIGQPVASPAAQIVALIDRVGALVETGVLPRRPGRLLRRTLGVALRLVERDRPRVGGVLIAVFILEVRVFERTGRLPAGDAAALIEAARAILADLVAPAAGAPDAARRPDVSPPTALLVHPPRPNPFASSTRVRFDVPAPAPVRVVVYDGVGREVARLLDGPLPAGPHEVTWRAGPTPAGLYFVRVSDGRHTRTRAVTLVR